MRLHSAAECLFFFSCHHFWDIKSQTAAWCEYGEADKLQNALLQLKGWDSKTEFEWMFRDSPSALWTFSWADDLCAEVSDRQQNSAEKQQHNR